MNINADIIKSMKENINKNSSFEFIAKLKDVTILDIDYIEEMLEIKSKLTYQIIDNIYIRISYTNYL